MGQTRPLIVSWYEGLGYHEDQFEVKDWDYREMLSVVFRRGCVCVCVCVYVCARACVCVCVCVCV